MNNYIAGLIQQSDEIEDQKKIMEYKLEKLGVLAEKIKEAAEIQDRPFMRTEDREKEDKQRAEKRKQEEELKEEEKQEEKNDTYSRRSATEKFRNRQRRRST